MGRFDGKAVLVTGANSGIGAATAKAFGAEGARLMLTGIDAEAGAAVMAEINGAGGDARFIHGDLTDAGFRDGLIDRAVAEMGRLDVLCNNAGINRHGTVDQLSHEDYRLIMTINIDTVFALSRAAIPVMKAQGSGAIVNTASELGETATANIAAYCSSKGAVVQLTRAMALENARDGIRINAICPGPVMTDLLIGGRDEAYLARTAEAVPMGRVGEPFEIANAILFLASDEASFMTGSMMIVDGGVTAG
jgi:meso-butanediol dehydrogenase/(S,S)-butanediol dehydrogenase/diacetyl reductase